MYESYFGLNERPFDLTPNPRYLLLTPTHREALSNLEYGICARKGITVLLGEAGTGKTTLVRKVLAARLREGLEASSPGWVYLNNPTLTRAEFFEALACGFGLGDSAVTSKTRLLADLEALLIERQARGAATALIVDEAQSVPHEILEELRLLANIESDTHKLLPLVLAGQPELADRLNSENLRQLKQRVALRCELRALTLQETGAYIATRIRLAGGDAGRIFSRDAVIAVHDASRGIPRTISVICDNALLAAFADGMRAIGADTVNEVCRDFDLFAPPTLAERPRENTEIGERLAFAGSTRTTRR